MKPHFDFKKLFYLIFDANAPAPVEAAPAPVEAAPAHVEAAPAPVEAAPAPVEAAPTPAPVLRQRFDKELLGRAHEIKRLQHCPWGIALKIAIAERNT